MTGPTPFPTIPENLVLPGRSFTIGLFYFGSYYHEPVISDEFEGVRTMNMKDRMIQGLLYQINDPLRADMQRARRLLSIFNNTTEEETDARKRLIRELFGSVGDNILIQPPFYCDYGSNISVGHNFYANFNCVLLDVCPIAIGNNVMLGPQVGIYPATHPIDARVRAMMVELGKPVAIGDDVWIGGHAVINGGVSIGSETVIGSGSVVTKSIPSGVIAAGNPCRIIREIAPEDAVYWERQRSEFDQAMR